MSTAKKQTDPLAPAGTPPDGGTQDDATNATSAPVTVNGEPPVDHPARTTPEGDVIQPGAVPIPAGTDPADPTKYGTFRTSTPLDTRSSGDMSGHRDDADKMFASNDGGERNRRGGQRDGGSGIDVPEGGAVVPSYDTAAMSAMECKAVLAGYGLEITLNDARAVLDRTLAQAK